METVPSRALALGAASIINVLASTIWDLASFETLTEANQMFLSLSKVPSQFQHYSQYQRTEPQCLELVRVQS